MAQTQQFTGTGTVVRGEEIEYSEDDDSWKAVGSPPRRASVSTPLCINTSTASRRGSTSSDWDSFGGLQWDILKETVAPRDILSVPMVPNVPLEPSYRQQRSLSFSMGQDPSTFGYDDYSDKSTTLATMREEDEDNYGFSSRSLGGGAIAATATAAAAASRVRSQSSEAAFHPRHSLRRWSEQSTPFMWQTPDIFENPFYPPRSDPDKIAASGFFQRRDSLSSIATPPTSLQESLVGSSSKQQQQHRPSLSPLSPLPPPSLHQPSPLPSPAPAAMTPNASNVANPFTQLQKVPEEEQPVKKKSIYMVEFKAGRTDFFYSPQELQVGDLVIVEADRGRDLGKVAMNDLTEEQITLLQSQKDKQQQQQQQSDAAAEIGCDHATATKNNNNNNNGGSLDSLKRIHRLAAPDEINQLLSKKQDEHRALSVCQQKIKQRKLRMEVVDAEYQWDRRKLTFYFIAEKRIDFRELVRELFKVYKTRIWMCAVNPTTTNHKSSNNINHSKSSSSNSNNSNKDF